MSTLPSHTSGSDGLSGTGPKKPEDMFRNPMVLNLTGTDGDDTTHNVVGGNTSKTRLSNKSMTHNFRADEDGIRVYTQEELARYEAAVNDSDSVEELESYLINTFNIDPELTTFLKTAGVGGIRKLREFYHQAIAFDLKYGTKTTQYISEDLFHQLAAEHPEEFAAPGSAQHTVKHRPSLTSSVVDTLTQMQRIMQADGVSTRNARFVDLGSGSGKPTIIAAHPDFGFEFKLSVGVDNYETLNKVLDRNAERAGIAAERIKSVNSDAADFIDLNGVNGVLSYNSFGKKIASRVEQNIRKYGGRAVVGLIKPLQASFFESARGGKFWTLAAELGAPNGNTSEYDPDKHIKVFTHGFGLD